MSDQPIDFTQRNIAIDILRAVTNVRDDLSKAYIKLKI